LFLLKTKAYAYEAYVQTKVPGNQGYNSLYNTMPTLFV